MKTILVDPSRCLQCSNCWVACKDEHSVNDWSPIAAPATDDQWWIQVDETEVASGAQMKLHRVPIMCQHCENASCIKACPNNAIYRRDDGIVIIDPTKCKGSGKCMEACPYDRIFFNAERKIAQKCTMCAHLLDAGWEMPRCVRACPNDALTFVDSDELTDENMYAPLEHLHEEYGTKPQVAYVRLPVPFVAGELASSDEAVCVEGAQVTVVNQVTGATYEGYSGTFGDFHVDVKKPGFYKVTFAKDGYKRKTISDVDLRQSLSLDVVKLWQTTE
ncbi:MAG: 4Fe-4S dicluster domain-containing protein [Coriobacteriia bacterium]|nr:4Fe-4S dicluster domain-containing protein [Coriobacteriia bacterium]